MSTLGSPVLEPGLAYEEARVIESVQRLFIEHVQGYGSGQSKENPGLCGVHVMGGTHSGQDRK